MRTQSKRFPWQIYGTAGMALVLVVFLVQLAVNTSDAQEKEKKKGIPTRLPQSSKSNPGAAAAAVPPAEPVDTKVGLEINDPRAAKGYTLIAPMTSTKTFLIDMEGRVVNSWECGCNPALGAYLLENGNLLRSGQIPPIEQPFSGPGAGGRVQEYTWNGELIWDYRLVNDKQLPHHDLMKLPNGNILMVVWDKKSKEEAIAAGHKPEVPNNQVRSDSIIEIKPTGKNSGEIVWQWNVWDHIVQELDKKKPNYGRISDHPELVDINFGDNTLSSMMTKKEDLEKLKSIGYVGGSSPTTSPGLPGMPPGAVPDWTHINGVAYNAELDQVMLSVHSFSEIWIIDHSTTTAEAASHKGGKRGKGGDLLYRWGNPRTYRSGTNADQRLFNQHSAHWIPNGLPGEGHILIFNNGNRRQDGAYSTVDEIVLPEDGKGTYTRKPFTAFGPDKAAWTYQAPKKEDLFSMLISGAQRLPNGNTLICSGVAGQVFEVTPQGDVVWKYTNPVKGMPTPPGGGPGGFGPRPQVGNVIPQFLIRDLRINEVQKKEIESFQQESIEKMDKILTAEEKKLLLENLGPESPLSPRPGEILSSVAKLRLELTDEQKKEVDDLQKKANEMLAKVLRKDQQLQLEDMRTAKKGGPGGKSGGKRGMAGGKGGPPGGPPGMGQPAPRGSLFRSYRYAPDYAGLAGKELKPGAPLEDLDKEIARKRLDAERDAVLKESSKSASGAAPN